MALWGYRWAGILSYRAFLKANMTNQLVTSWLHGHMYLVQFSKLKCELLSHNIVNLHNVNVNGWKSSKEEWIYEQTMDRWADNAKLSICALIHRNEWPRHNERWAESLHGFILLKGSNIRRTENRICNTFLFLSLIYSFCGLFNPFLACYTNVEKEKTNEK